MARRGPSEPRPFHGTGHPGQNSPLVWAMSTVATLGLALIPIGAALVGRAIGLPGPDVVVAVLLGVCTSLAYLSGLRRLALQLIPGTDGDILLWSLVRRSLAAKKIREVVSELETARAVPPTIDQPIWPLRQLASALDRKDRYTSGHCKRVESQATRLAIELELDAGDVEDLRLAAALHDVGKIDVPTEILNKPGELTEQEFEIVRTHPTVGARMIGPAVTGRVMDAVLHHHERWDGAGYPNGVAGPDIPLFSRVIAVIDAYDAMTSERPYRSAMSHDRAIDVLKHNSGSQFDPQMVDLFVETFEHQARGVGAWALLAPLETARRAGFRWRQALASHGSQAMGATTAAVVVSVASIVAPASDGTVGMADAHPSGRQPAAVVSPLVSGDPLTDEVRELRVRRAGKAERAVEEPVVKRDGTDGDAPEDSDAPPDPPGVETHGSSGQGGPSPEAAQPAVGSKEEPSGEPEEEEDEGSQDSDGDSKSNRGHTPPGDPQPQHGNDCSHPGRGKGEGTEKHCS